MKKMKMTNKDLEDSIYRILWDVFKSGNNGEILEFTGGVDSGQFGYFDHDEYRNDNIVQGVERVTPDDVICDDEPWYSICCDRTLSKDKWGEIPFGIVSSSGYGDGSYPTYGIKDVDGKEWVGFVTLFIWDDDEEDEDDE